MGKKKGPSAVPIAAGDRSDGPSTSGRPAIAAAAEGRQQQQKQLDHAKPGAATKGVPPKAKSAAGLTPGAASAGVGTSGTAATKKRAAKDEMNDIFASKKQKASSSMQDAPAAGATGAAGTTKSGSKQLRAEGTGKQAAPTPKVPKVQGSKDDIFGAAAASGRKRTEEGYAIYTEDELGLGKQGGGDTDLCPFDCDCCF